MTPCEATQFHKHGVTNNGQNASTDEKVIWVIPALWTFWHQYLERYLCIVIFYDAGC